MSNDGLHQRGIVSAINYYDNDANRHIKQDRNALARLGRQEELKRRFGFYAIFGFSCAILITWEASLSIFAQVFYNGGPAGLAWGFPISWICGMSVFTVIAEMASMAPIAGGQYFWVAILSDRPQRRFLSYLAGWLTTLAWVSTLTTVAIFVGTQIQGLITLNYSNYSSHTWHGTLLSWGVLAISLFINTVIAGSLPFLEGFVFFIHIIGFFATLITLVYLSPHQPASAVFFTPINIGGFPTQAMAYCVGFIGNVGVFTGADAAVHMSEEIDNAAVNVPRAIVSTLLINGIAGYAMVLAVLFCLNDIPSALHSKTGFPFIQIFADNIGNGGATALTSLVISLDTALVIGAMATASRIIWSFARDKGVPFSGFISRVDITSSVPLVALVVVTIVPVLITLIYIGSATAFTNIVSLTVSGLYSSYLFPCSLLLWRRIKGQIEPYDPDKYSNHSILDRLDASDLNDAEKELELPLMWGPWKVPGVFGLLNNIFACVYCLFVLFWCFWPSTYEVDPTTMNWSILVYGATNGFAIIYYFVHGKKQYKGPLVDRAVALARS